MVIRSADPSHDIPLHSFLTDCMEVSELESRLFGEERQVKAGQADSLTAEDIPQTATINGTTETLRRLNEPTHIESIGYERRLENYAGISRNHPEVRALNTRADASLVSGEPEEDGGRANATMADQSLRTSTANDERKQMDTSHEPSQEHTCPHIRCLESHAGLDYNDFTAYFKRTSGVKSVDAFCSIRTELFESYPWISRALAKFRAVTQLIMRQRAFGMLNEWFLEFMALILSISSFTAIVVLLSMHHGQVQPVFVNHISINALVAIFSTILRATVLFIVSEGKFVSIPLCVRAYQDVVIGEMKWAWMELPRPLRDMEYFANAAAGPWGSLEFLISLRKPLWTMAGAIVVIASTTIGPFSQQAFATYTCDTNSEEYAQIRVAKNMSRTMTPLMRGTALGSLMHGVADNFLPSSSLFKCLGESCSFLENHRPEYTSVSICSSCVEANVSMNEIFKLNVTNNLINYPPDGPAPEWPNGVDSAYALKMTAIFEPMPELANFENDMQPYVFNDSLRGANTTILIRALTDSESGTYSGIIPFRTESGQRLGLLAMNCSIFPCYRKYNMQVVNGTFNEEVIARKPLKLVAKARSAYANNQNRNQYQGEFTHIIDPCHNDNQWYNFSNISTATISTANAVSNHSFVGWKNYTFEGKPIQLPTSCLGTIGHVTYGSIQDFIDKQATGSCTVSKLGSPPILKAGELDCGDKWWLQSMMRGGSVSFDSVSAAFDRMTTSITDLVRANAIDGVNTKVAGLINKPTNCVQANWAWLLYPGMVLVLTTTLFVKTCTHSGKAGRRRPVWKSSVLPLMFYDISARRDRSDAEDAQRDVVVPLLTLAELKAVAKHTVIWFDSEADAPGFDTKLGECGLKNVLVSLKENGDSALLRKRHMRSGDKFDLGP